MIREKMWVERPDHTHLSQSQKDPDGFSSLARRDETNELDTHATLFSISEDEADTPRDECAPAGPGVDPLAAAAILAAGIALGVVADKAGPPIKRWLNDDALPAVKSVWSRIARARGADSQTDSAVLPTLIEAGPAGFSKEVEAALEERGISMSSAEWLEHFRAWLVAGALKEEQRRILSNARIEDGDQAVLEWQSALDNITAAQLEDRIALMLETNPSFFDEGTLTELAAIFGRGRIVDGQSVPVRTEHVNEALRLTDGCGDV